MGDGGPSADRVLTLVDFTVVLCIVLCTVLCCAQYNRHLIGGAVRAMVARRILENFRGSSGLRSVALKLVDRAKSGLSSSEELLGARRN